MNKDSRIDECIFDKVRADLGALFGDDIGDPSWSARRFEIIKIFEKLPKGGTLLDVGTGQGFVPRYFHEAGAKVISVDYPATGGLDALKALINLGIQGHYLEVGVDTLPLPDDSVDVVFVGNVIEHLPHSPKKFMADLKRVLRPGGHLVMDTKNAVDLKTRIKVLCGLSNWAPLKSYYELGIHPHHHKEYTLRELTELFELAGFRNNEPISEEFFFQLSLKRLGTLQAMGSKVNERSRFGTGFNPWQPYEYARLMLLFLTRIFPGLRGEIMVIGQK